MKYNVIDLVITERVRQELLKEDGKFPWTCATRHKRVTPHHKLAVLAEEFGEVARAICEQDAKNLKEELVQVAAVCVAWLESLP